MNKYIHTLSNGVSIDIRHLKKPASLWVRTQEDKGGNIEFQWGEVLPTTFDDAVSLNKFYDTFEWFVGHHPKTGRKFCIPVKKEIAWTEKGLAEIVQIQQSSEFWEFCIEE